MPSRPIPRKRLKLNLADHALRMRSLHDRFWMVRRFFLFGLLVIASLLALSWWAMRR